MFIQKELFKSINELYFTKYIEEIPLLSSVNNIDDIINNIKILKSLKIKKDEFYYMHKDIINNSISSKLAKSLSITRKVLSEKVKRNIELQSPETKEVIELLLKYSNESYLVGGAVRDSIIGLEPNDYDFVTDINYDILKEIFIVNDFQVKETGKEFLVLNISKNGSHFEIANFRKDGTYTDGRRPNSVEIGTIDEDAERRDFTINALYFNLFTKEVYDPTGNGIQDAKNKVLRFVGNPKDRIKEDFLRGWRFIRFINIGFTPENKSYKVIKSNWADIYNNSNSQRVLTEILKMIKE